VGIHQARCVGRALRPYLLSGVYCSPLKRARETAQLIGAELDTPVEVIEALSEIDTGLWTGFTWEQVGERWPEESRAFHEDPGTHGYLGGETLAQVHNRVLPVVQGLVTRHQGETFLIVSHGVVNRVLLAHWLGVPLRHARQLPQDNAGINVVEFRNGVPSVRTVNAVAHLIWQPLAA
jgi:broad specificity phosphatase PhoE